MVDLIVQTTSRALDSLREWTPYAVGRVLRSTSQDKGSGEASLVLIRSEATDGSELSARDSDCFLVPHGLEPHVAIFAPPVAWALWAWDQLALELGEAAVYTDGHPLANLIGQVAAWMGACPIIRLGTEIGPCAIPQVELLHGEDPQALNNLKRRTAGKPGFAAIDLSGHPEIIDILFEALPQWGRLMLASHRTQPLTVDLYGNIHRKGASIVSTIFDPSIALGRGFGDHLRRACVALQTREIIADNPR